MNMHNCKGYLCSTAFICLCWWISWPLGGTHDQTFVRFWRKRRECDIMTKLTYHLLTNLNSANCSPLITNSEVSWVCNQGHFFNLENHFQFGKMFFLFFLFCGSSLQNSTQNITHDFVRNFHAWIRNVTLFFAENSSSRVRTLQGVSEESVPHGVSDRRQTKLP